MHPSLPPGAPRGTPRQRSTSTQRTPQQQHRNRSNDIKSNGTKNNNHHYHHSPSDGESAGDGGQLPHRSKPLPCISPLQSPPQESMQTQALTRYPALPFVPPTYPRKLAEMPSFPSIMRSPLLSSSEVQQEPPQLLSDSRRLHMPQEVVVMLTSPASSVASLNNNVLFSMSGDPPFLEPVVPLPRPDGSVVCTTQQQMQLQQQKRYSQSQMLPPLPATYAGMTPLPNAPVMLLSTTQRLASASFSSNSDPAPVFRGGETDDDNYDDAVGGGVAVMTRKRSQSPQAASIESNDHTEAFDSGAAPKFRIHARQKERSVGSGPSSDDDDDDYIDVSAQSAMPHVRQCHCHRNRVTSKKLSDLSGAPSKTTIAANVHLLCDFFQRHPPEKPTEAESNNNNSARPPPERLHFSEREKEEIARLINNLQTFVRPPPSDSSELLAAVAPSAGGTPQPSQPSSTMNSPSPLTPSQQESLLSLQKYDTSPNARKENNNNNSFSNPSPVTWQAAILEIKQEKVKPTPTLILSADYSTASSASTLSSAQTSVARRNSSARQEGMLPSEQGSVEGRYKEALKTIEEAASDCQVALQRVQDYSENLYTLVRTWMHLHDNRFDEFARAVLQRLLDDNPSYRVLFHHVRVPRQSLIIMDMIGRAVVAFTRPADLMDIMGEVGARHNLYRLGEDHYVALRDAFLQVYAEFVGPETYNKSVGVWKMFWKTTIELAVSGANSERGEIYTQRRNVVWAARVKSIFKSLIPRQRSGGFHRLMQATYKRAVAQHPELYVLQQLADLRTAHRTMETLICIVKSLTDGSTPVAIEYNDQLSIQNLLTDCGAELDADMMKKLEEPFLEACESFLASTNTWNIVARSALQELWSTYITGYWTAQPLSAETKGNGGTAPDGKEPFCLMFTDIEASTRLWDSDAQTMSTAVHNHHKLIRGLIKDFGGYEVKTVGDSFLIATSTVTQALLIAFGIQLELMAGPSAPTFHMVSNPQGGGDETCWRDDALRVRVGIHHCTDASAVYDRVHNRFDYYGPGVNCASRVEAAACGGQVLLSGDAYEKLQGEASFCQLPIGSLFAEQLGKLVQAQEARGIEVTDRQLTYFSAAVKRAELGMESVRQGSRQSVGAATTMMSLTHVEDVGCQVLKGIAEPVHLYSLLPVGLDGRRFR
jgi:class 3 adenylate cyclase/hemoglobin-like flavoprotein